MTKTSFCSGAVGKPAPFLAKGGFLVSKDFYPHQHSWWLLYSLSLQSNAALPAIGQNAVFLCYRFSPGNKAADESKSSVCNLTDRTGIGRSEKSAQANGASKIPSPLQGSCNKMAL